MRLNRALECYFETVDKETSKAIQWDSEARSFKELAASQAVGLVMELETLLGHPSGEDESCGGVEGAAGW